MDVTPEGVRILGLIGYQGSGKSTVAAMLEDGHGFYEVGFADPLREILAAFDPLVMDDSIPGGYATYRSLLEEYGYDEMKRRFPDVRRMLQALGTDGIRKHLGENAWVDAWERSANLALANRKRVVSADVRFMNEIDRIHELGGVIARVIRPGAHPAGSHESEAVADRYPGSFPIYNDGDLAKLEVAVDELSQALVQMDPLTGRRWKS